MQDTQTSRTELISAATRVIPNRFELCRLVVLEVRKFKRPDSRIQEEIGAAFERVANNNERQPDV